MGSPPEDEHLIDKTKAKLKRKGCDWISRNDVSTDTADGRRERKHRDLSFCRGTADDIEVDSWPRMTKEQVAVALMPRSPNT